MLLEYHYKFVLLNLLKWSEIKIKKTTKYTELCILTSPLHLKSYPADGTLSLINFLKIIGFIKNWLSLLSND